ncbi:hypothetical protein BSNK01_09230 [Bacillaceae bacterium]
MCNKLMVVAHPDDESIFGGALLLKRKGWKVVCATNGDDERRRNEFKKAMEYVGAKHEIWNYKDKWKGDFDRKSLRQDIQRLLTGKKYDMVVTHGLQGEYGHTQHIALAEIVHRLVRKNLYSFAVSEEILALTLLRKKLKLLKYYKSQEIEKYKKYIVYEGIEKIR